MLGGDADVVKAGKPWSWQLFVSRSKRFLQLLGVLTIVLLLVACVSFLIRLYLNQRPFFLRVSSPISPLQADHPLNITAPARGQAREARYEPSTLHQVGQPSPAGMENASMRKSQRFFEAATAAAAQGGVVLQWGDNTIRLLRGAAVREVFFLFYEPSTVHDPVSTNTEGIIEGIAPEEQMNPVEVFKQLAQEDRDEQQQYQLPFVVVPRQEMHRLSFFLPEYAERKLPLAMVVRLDSGWTKFQAPLNAPYSLAAMRAFLSSYRKGESPPLLRTESLPVSIGDTEDVKSIVASNFSRTILEETNYDSLVLLYANWCGHCRRFQKNMQHLAERFRGISSIVFFKMDVSRNDIPVPGLRVERIPHVVFFARDPEESSNAETSLPSSDAVEAARAAAAATAADSAGSIWHLGEGVRRKKIITFSHAEPDVLTYGEAFLLQHAACKSIDLERLTDCNNAEAKDAEDL